MQDDRRGKGQTMPAERKSRGAQSDGNTIEVALAFDQQSYRVLEEIKAAAGLTSTARTVREALRIMRALQQLGNEGYTDVIVQNPMTADQQLLTIEHLNAGSPSKHDAPSVANILSATQGPKP